MQSWSRTGSDNITPNYQRTLFPGRRDEPDRTPMEPDPYETEPR